MTRDNLGRVRVFGSCYPYPQDLCPPGWFEAIKSYSIEGISCNSNLTGDNGRRCFIWVRLGAREISRWLKVLAVLSEGPGQFPEHTVAHNCL